MVLPRAVASMPGPISLNKTPYLREILRAVTDPDVEEITIMSSTQVGKSTCEALPVLYYSDQDPWPALYVGPKEDSVEGFNRDTLQKIILESPGLKRHLSDSAYDMTASVIRLNGTAIHFASANSPASLAQRAICILVLDETDKYPMFSGKEADPIALARERTRTFLFRKILKVSTPTTQYGYIYQEFMAGDRRRYWVPCPHCGVYQVLVMGGRDPGGPGIHWPADMHDPERLLDQHAAWYECESCHEHISDQAKPGMLRRGRWVPETQKILPDGSLEGPAPSRRRLSYHLWAGYSPWLTWSEIAAEFLRSKDSPGRLMNFRNSWEGWIWEETAEEVKDAHLRARQGGYEYGTVPPEAHLLTAGVDVQLDHLYYVIRAWGVDLESWLVRIGVVDSWEALDRVLYHSHYLAAGTRETVPLQGVFIDCGYRTDEVIAYCRRTKATAIKGDSRQTRGVGIAHHRNSDGTVTSIALLPTDYLKRKLHRMIRTPEGPGSWHLPTEVDDEYFHHMVAEQMIRKTDKRTGRTVYQWKVVQSGAPNHWFDGEVYALAGAELLDVEHRFHEPPERKEIEESVEATAKQAESQPERAPPPAPVEPKRSKRRFTRVGANYFSRRG